MLRCRGDMESTLGVWEARGEAPGRSASLHVKEQGSVLRLSGSQAAGHLYHGLATTRGDSCEHLETL